MKEILQAPMLASVCPVFCPRSQAHEEEAGKFRRLLSPYHPLLSVVVAGSCDCYTLAFSGRSVPLVLAGLPPQDSYQVANLQTQPSLRLS